MRERRYKILQLDYRMILTLFNWNINPTRFLKLPKCNGQIPEDVKIISTSSDWASDSFQLMLFHPSWSIVPEGVVPPVINSYILDFETREFPFVEST